MKNTRAHKDEETRFMEKVEKTLDTCWEWSAYKNPKGYGMFRPYQSTRPVMAHRWLYEKYFGKVEKGLVLDHLCENKSCVNPEHLEPVSNAENLRRANVGQKNAEYHLKKTHCRNGHEYTKENTRYTNRKSRGVLTRACVTCYNNRSNT